MPAYAYPIEIDYSRRVVTETHEHQIQDFPITIETLQSIVHEHRFWIIPSDSGVVVSVKVDRPETDEEMTRRIAGGEQYMAVYKRRQARACLCRHNETTTVSELYDDDEEFASAVRDWIGEGFEYPDWSHKTVAQLLTHRHKAAP